MLFLPFIRLDFGGGGDIVSGFMKPAVPFGWYQAWLHCILVRHPAFWLCSARFRLVITVAEFIRADIFAKKDGMNFSAEVHKVKKLIEERMQIAKGDVPKKSCDLLTNTQCIIFAEVLYSLIIQDKSLSTGLSI